MRILHAADLHLDSPFEGLSAGKAALRRGEQRDLLYRLANLATNEKADVVLLAGDLLDSDKAFRETAEDLVRSLSMINVPVFISPGNHDWYSSKCPYAKVRFPENVRIFKKQEIEAVELEGCNAVVYGAAFTGKHSEALTDGFKVPEQYADKINIMCIHGEYGNRESLYNPVSEEKIAGSGLDYLALGHIHKASGLLKTGGTYVSWPGCPEGRGFDETGMKYVNIIDLEKGSCSLSQISISSRKYEILYVDVTDTDPVLAIHSSIPDETVKDVYRIVLRGETDEFLDLNRIKRSLSDLFFEYRIKDETRLKRNIWDSAGDDSLRGLFLAKMMKRYDSAKTESEKKAIESSVRWGLAAIDNAEEVCVHEN